MLGRWVCVGTCVDCKKTRMGANYRVAKGGGIFDMCHSDNPGIFSEKITRARYGTTRRGERATIYLSPADLALAAHLLIERISVTATIHRLSHDAVACAGHVATFPKPVGPMAEVFPRLPPDATIVRLRRGAKDASDKKKTPSTPSTGNAAGGALPAKGGQSILRRRCLGPLQARRRRRWGGNRWR